MKPLDWQEVDLAKLEGNNWSGLLAIATGGGKSVEGTVAGVRSGADTKLLIAPQGTLNDRDGWEYHVNELDPSPRFQRIRNDSKAGRSALADLQWGVPGWYAVTPQLFARLDLSQLRPDMTIADEFHQLLGPRGSKHIRALQTGARIPMSGTMARNKVSNLWVAARFVAPHLGAPGQVADKSKYRWLDRWLVEEYDHFAHNHKKYEREKAPGAILAALPCVILHKRRERCCDFHPHGFLSLDEPQVREIEVELTAVQKRAIHTMENEYIAYLKGNPMIASLPIVAQQRLRQLTLGEPTVTEDDEVVFDLDCASPMLDTLLDVLAKVDYEPTVVFTSSEKFAHVVAHRLTRAGIPAMEYTGTNPDRETQRSGFEAGAYTVMVVTIAAGGTGLNLQHAASNEVWLDFSVDPTENEQARSRLDRMGQRKQVQRWVLLDSAGYNQGRMSAQLEAQLRLNQSFTLAPTP